MACASIGIPCRTAPRQRQRMKQGRQTRAGPSSSRLPDANSIPTPAVVEPSPSGEEDVVWNPTGARLLGVPGLSRKALDECIDTHFATVGRVFTLTEPQPLFLRRTRVLLYYKAGLDLPAELSDVADNPASELFVLAVACCGARFSPHAHLSDALHARCVELMAIPETLTRDGLDNIEAVALLAEQSIRTRHAKLGSTTSPTQLDPLGKGSLVDLVFYHKLHIPPPPGSRDIQRRQTLFWFILIHDAYRSASANTCYRIADEDIGWPIPPDDISIRLPYLTLGRTIRKVSAKLLSPRAKGVGLQDSDVLDILDTLNGLRARIGLSIDKLVANLSSDPEVRAANPPPLNWTTPMEPIAQLFLMSTHNWLYLLTWVAVKEDSEKRPGNLPLGTLNQVDAITMSACEDMVALAKIGTLHQLHRYGPKPIRNQMAAYYLFLVRVFTSIEAPTPEHFARYFTYAEALYDGVRSVSGYSDSPTLADTLRSALHRATRVDLREATRVAERGLEGLQQSDSAPKAHGKLIAQNSTLAPATADPVVPLLSLQMPAAPQEVPTASYAGQGPSSAISMDPWRSDPTLAAELDPVAALDWPELMESLRDFGFDLSFP